MWRALCIVALCAAAAAGAARPAGSGASPRTVLSLRTPIYAFARDGGTMAWMVADDTCGVLVRERAITGGPVTTLTTQKGQTCQDNLSSPVGAGDLVLARTHALWTTYSASNEEDDAEVTLGVPGRADTGLDIVGWTGGNDAGNHTVPSVPMAGSGSTLVYADNGDILARGELYRAVSKSCCRIGTVNGDHALSVDAGRIAAAVTTIAGTALTDEPSWSRTSSIVFSSFRDGNTGIYTVAPGGGAWRLVSETVDSGIGTPAWSPDGERIAFVREDLWVMNADGSGRKRLTSGHEVSTPSWTPDGKQLVWTDGLDGTIWSVGAAGGGSHRLIKIGSDELDGPAVAPGGKRIAFFDTNKNHLVVSGLDGRNRTAIGSGEDPAWSPDGKKIASSTCRIRVAAPDGTGAHAITTPPGKLCDLHPAWSPDGGSIVFSRGQTDVTGDLYVVRSDGTGLRRLTTTVPVPARDEVRVVTGNGKPAGALEHVAATAVAMSGPTLVAVTKSGLQVLDATSGRLKRTIVVTGTVESIAVSGHRLVYYARGAIWLADTTRGAPSRLATTALPDGLSIDGTLVVWAESYAKTSRIEELRLP